MITTEEQEIKIDSQKASKRRLRNPNKLYELSDEESIF